MLVNVIDHMEYNYLIVSFIILIEGNNKNLNITEYNTDVHLNDLSTSQILPSNESVSPRLSASPPKSGNLWPGLTPPHKKGKRIPPLQFLCFNSWFKLLILRLRECYEISGLLKLIELYNHD